MRFAWHFCICHIFQHCNCCHGGWYFLSVCLHASSYLLLLFLFSNQTFFPEHMVAWCQESSRTIPPSQLLQVRAARITESLLSHQIFAPLHPNLIHLTSDLEVVRRVRAFRDNYCFSHADTQLSAPHTPQAHTCDRSIYRLLEWGFTLP